MRKLSRLGLRQLINETLNEIRQKFPGYSFYSDKKDADELMMKLQPMAKGELVQIEIKPHALNSEKFSVVLSGFRNRGAADAVAKKIEKKYTVKDKDGRVFRSKVNARGYTSPADKHFVYAARMF